MALALGSLELALVFVDAVVATALIVRRVAATLLELARARRLRAEDGVSRVKKGRCNEGC